MDGIGSSFLNWNVIDFEAWGFLWLFVGYLAGVALHEAGHAVVAWALGFQPRLISIGVGPVLARVPLGQAWLIWRALPIAGYVQFPPPPAGKRAMRMAITAAGPLVNLTLLGAFAAAHGARRDYGLGGPWNELAITALIVSQAVILAATLMPSRGRSSQLGRPLASDGLRLWRMIRGPDDDQLAAVRALCFHDILPPGTPLPAPSPRSADLAYQCVRLDRWRDPWAARDATRVTRAFLSEPIPPMERALALSFLVGNELMFGPAGVTLAELDTWSEEILALAPRPAQHITRAGVLIRLGHAAEARTRLLRCLKDPLEGMLPSIARLFLARAEAALGDPGRGQEWLAMARAQLPAAAAVVMQPVLERIRAEIEAAPSIKVAA